MVTFILLLFSLIVSFEGSDNKEYNFMFYGLIDYFVFFVKLLGKFGFKVSV